MKKISSFVLASSLVFASSAAFAGGMADPIVEPVIPVVVEENSSSSALPLWAIIGGVVLVGAALSGDSGSDSNTTAPAAN